MFYDLNVPWTASNASQIPRTLAFLSELGYNVVALNHQISGKLPADLTCPIPPTIPSTPPTLQLLRRCTLTLTDTHQNARLAALSHNYDLLALRPIDEKSLSLACTSLDCDIISLDLSQRLPFWFKYKMLAEAVKSGKKLEICYAQGVAGGDAGARRNLISNATQLIRASRGGRGVVISSEARSAVQCRGPWDAINLAAVLGLGQERGVEAMGNECRSVVVSARLKRTSYRGVIDVVYGGEKPAVEETVAEKEVAHVKGKLVKGQKRKADAIESADAKAGAEKPISKRQMKRQAKEARRQELAGSEGTTAASGSATSETPQHVNGKG